MRGALGTGAAPSKFTNAVTRAEALGYSIPQVAATGVATLPGDDYFSCNPDGTEPGPTTPTSAQFLNAIIEESKAILDLGNVATPGGLAFDPADNTQLSQVLGPIRAIDSDAADTGAVSNIHKRAVICGEGQATGTGAHCIGSEVAGVGSLLASGNQSRVASTYAPSGANAASGDRSRIDCSEVLALGGTLTASGARSVVDGCGATFPILASGAQSAVRSTTATLAGATASGIGSVIESSDVSGANAITVSGNYSRAEGCITTGGVVTVSGNQASAIASSGPVTVSASLAACIASDDCTVSTSTEQAVIASHGVTSSAGNSAAVGAVHATVSGAGAFAVGMQAAAGLAAVVSGARSGVLASTLDTAVTTVGGPESLLVCSTGTTLVPGVVTTGQLYGGTGGAVKARINFATGDYHSSVGAAYNAAGADYAEMFPLLATGEPLPPRRLVTLVGRKARLAEGGDRLHGAVSAAPAVLGNSPEDMSTSTPGEWVKVALLGQVEVETAGQVASGDILVAGPNGRGIAAEYPNLRDRRVEVLDVVEPFDADRGYGLALCLIG